MIEPPPRCFINGITAWQANTCVKKLSANPRCHCSDVSSSNLPAMRKPTLATSTSMRLPKGERTCSIPDLTPCSVLKSATTVLTVTEGVRLQRNSSARCESPSSLMSSKARLAPASANASAIAEPIPPAAPVMHTTFPGSPFVFIVILPLLVQEAMLAPSLRTSTDKIVSASTLERFTILRGTPRGISIFSPCPSIRGVPRKAPLLMHKLEQRYNGHKRYKRYK